MKQHTIRAGLIDGYSAYTATLLRRLEYFLVGELITRLPCLRAFQINTLVQ